MKRLAVLAGLATLSLATPAQAAEKTCDTWISGKYVPCAPGGQPQATPQRTPEEQAWWEKNCGYGGTNTKDPRCAQIEGSTGTGTKPWPDDGKKPPPGQQTTQNCPPGTVLLRYGTRYRCVKRGGSPGQDQAASCQPGWIWSPRLYRCVPGTVGQGGRDCRPGWIWSSEQYRCVKRRDDVGQYPPEQQESGRRICGYGKVWSDRLDRCVPFRTGGGDDGGGYRCGPGERWSDRAYRCVPRRGGSGGIYIDLGGIGGNIGISNKRRCGHGTYWDGDRCVARRGGDDYSGGGVGYGPYEKRRGSGGNDRYGGRGR